MDEIARARTPAEVVRRNFVINIFEGGSYISSSAFISVQTVLPALVARLGGSNVEVGAVGLISWVGVFLPQIFAVRYGETLPWKKPYVIWFGVAQRSMMLLIGVAVFVFGVWKPWLALPLFFVLYALNQILAGLATPIWFDFFAKLTPANRRGRLVGIRTSVGGLGAFLCGFLLTWFLASFEFPASYALAFVVAALLQFTSIGLQARLQEAEPSVTTERREFFAFLRALPDVFRTNRDFRMFMLSAALLVIGTMPVGFFAVYALRHFNADESIIGEFTLIMVAIQIVSALVTGYIADRYGNKVALLFAGGAMALATLWALLAPTLFLFRFVYLFLGINIGTEVMARYNISIEYGPSHQRSLYIGLMNTVLAPFYFSALVAGIISDTLGYPVMFILGLVASLVGLFLLYFRVRDPRMIPPAERPEMVHGVAETV
jgi:MFS family permease